MFIRVDVDKKSWTLKGKIDKINLLGNYVVDGTILVIVDVTGNGKINITISKFKISGKCQGLKDIKGAKCYNLLIFQMT